MSRVSFYSALVLCLFYSEPCLAADEKFAGINMGVGLSFTHDLGWNDRVSKASIINNVVRVEEERNDIARVMLELHYFFTPNTANPFWGIGPFVAIQPGKDKIIDAIGLGVMVGFRHRLEKPDKDGNQWAANSWNFGVGFVVDPSSKILGDGFVANQAPPPGETSVRLKDTSQGGIMFITSFSFN